MVSYKEKSADIVEAKIVLLGDTGVGKTSIALRYTKESSTFTEQTNPTIGASFLMKTIQIDDKKLKLQIWDTAGAERFKSLAPMYYRGAVAAVLVFDITNANSIKKIKDWVSELQRNITESIIMVIVGNKKDKEEQRQVSDQEARQYASEQGSSYMETSAKTKEGIDETFNNLSRSIIKLYEERGRIEPEPEPKTVDPSKNNGSTNAQSQDDCC